MSSSRIMISQSNYIPWKGFFDSINTVDTYVVFDEVQYTRRDWRNRNKIKTPGGPIWLSIPVEVKGKFNQKISETKITSSTWSEDHWETIRHSYAKAPYFKQVAPYIQSLYKDFKGMELLSQVNVHFLKNISLLLGIKTEFIDSANFTLNEGKSERILGICSELKATDYFSGPSAKGYLDEDLFLKNNVNIHYFNFSEYEEYEQLYPPFEHSVSIIDLMFMKGPDCLHYMFKNSNTTTPSFEIFKSLEVDL